MASDPMTRKIMLMCRSQGSTPPSTERLLETADAMRDLTATGIDLHFHVQRTPGAHASTPHEDIALAQSPEFVAELTSTTAGADTHLHEAACTLARIMQPLTDAAGSSVFAGTEVMVTPGSGSTILIYGLRRKDGLTADQFMNQWAGEHAEAGQSVSDVRYRQIHLDVERTQALSAEIGYSQPCWDGIALSFFDDIAAAERIMSTQGVLAAIEDEKTFMDHRNSAFSYYTTL